MSPNDTYALQGLLTSRPSSPTFSPSPPLSHLASPLPNAPSSFIDNSLRKAKILQDKANSRWASATITERILVVTGAIIGATIGIFAESLLAALAAVAVPWRALPGGWLISFALIFITAFPPVMGYALALIVTGYVYGMKGWFICASATVIGSYCSFLASRTILSKYVHRLVGEDRHFKAFSSILKHDDSIKALVMIRLCPRLYGISNSAMSTIPTVNLLAFTAATAMTTPRLLIYVFAGSQFAAIDEAGSEMDDTTWTVNCLSILVFLFLGVVLGYLINRRTMAWARELEMEAMVDKGAYAREREEIWEGDEEERLGLALK
ncbi:hypothetical protein V493_06422 [Pseudogymnoascus sp. VKM F-4281 (FW-2241)]|nr:hypothetical protein V493_06422 [Pseudogymnoascus sp. VKM F-4281 (FW-2241)]